MHLIDTPENAPADEITFDDFRKVDIRVGTVLEAAPLPAGVARAEEAPLCGTCDQQRDPPVKSEFGSGGPRMYCVLE